MSKSVYIWTILAGVTGVVLAWAGYQWLLDIVLSGGQVRAFYTSPHNVLFHSFISALAFAPVGAAIYIGFRAPKSMVKGVFTIVAALIGGVSWASYMRHCFKLLRDDTNINIVFAGVPINILMDTVHLYQIGLASSVCAIVFLLGWHLWSRTARNN